MQPCLTPTATVNGLDKLFSILIKFNSCKDFIIIIRGVVVEPFRQELSIDGSIVLYQKFFDNLRHTGRPRC